jgi:hypothetical protein
MFRLNSTRRKAAAALTAVTLLMGTLLTPATWTNAADHGDSPNNTNDRQADLADVYTFLDPNDNSQVFLAMTFQGFIVPAEAMNFTVFDHNVRYRFELETSGDAAPDHFIDVTFSEKTGAASNPQRATVVSTFFAPLTGNTTVSNLSTNSPAPVITTNNNISLFAGQVDDPFFFDIPAFARFVGSVLGGTPNPSFFQRGRDSFAGYGTLAIALSIPRSLFNAQLSGTAGTTIGVAARTQRRTTVQTNTRPVRFSRNFVYNNADRAGIPAVNTALVPFPRKNEYNLSSPIDDANGRFANSIVGTLTALGTNNTNIGVLASVAVVRGDYLRLNLSTANSGPGGGNSSGAGFPNGRRLGDDVIDTILTIVANGTPLGDNVNSNDVAFRDQFPFFAPAAQPFDAGTTDDRTRN